VPSLAMVTGQRRRGLRHRTSFQEPCQFV